MKKIPGINWVKSLAAGVFPATEVDRNPQATSSGVGADENDYSAAAWIHNCEDCLRRGDYSLAIECALTAVALAPKDRRSQEVLGNAYSAAGRLGFAAEAYQRSCSIEASDSAAEGLRAAKERIDAGAARRDELWKNQGNIHVHGLGSEIARSITAYLTAKPRIFG